MKSMTELSHEFLKPVLKKGAICIDATLGQGSDTEFFLSCPISRLFSFDIQPHLIEQIESRIDDMRLKAFCESHERIDHIEELAGCKNQVSAVIFNFGYDPAQKSGIMTHPASSAKAIKAAMKLLRRKGRMALVFYPHEEGEREKETLLKMMERFSPYVEMQKVESPFRKSPSLLLCEKKRDIPDDVFADPEDEARNRL